MGFIPVNFGLPHPAAGKAHHTETLELAPAPGAITLPYACQTSDATPCGNRLDLRNLPNNFEVHLRALYQKQSESGNA